MTVIDSPQLLANHSIEIKLEQPELVNPEYASGTPSHGRLTDEQRFLLSHLLEQFSNDSIGLHVDPSLQTRQSTSIEYVDVPKTRMSMAHSRKAALAALARAETRRREATEKESAIFASLNDDLFGG